MVTTSTQAHTATAGACQCERLLVIASSFTIGGAALSGHAAFI
jgi:hypothetical protein